MIVRNQAKQIFKQMQASKGNAFPCTGRGTCHKCKVRVLEGVKPTPTIMEKRAFSASDLDEGYRLACCLEGDSELEVLYQESMVNNTSDSPILVDGKRQSIPWDPVIYWSKENQHLYFDQFDLGPTGHDQKVTCLAIDIGTTTLAVTLLDLRRQLEVDTLTAMNPQGVFGQDVMSRMSAVQSDPLVLERMQGLILDKIKQLGQDLLLANGYHLKDLFGVFVAANSVMNHILLGYSPISLGISPYELQFEKKALRSFEEIGFDLFGAGYLVCMENISAFVGGDIVAGLLAIDLGNQNRTELLIDIGTNGELVLAHQGQFYSTSCAAGPALEGMNIACGIIAQAGAIEEARFVKDRLRIRTIGHQKPIGICGSGILALIREFLSVGLITDRGRIAKPDQVKEFLRPFIDPANKRLWVDKKMNIYISQKDIRQIQLAKGAILSGISCLLLESKVPVDAVEKVYVAGQFGAHVKPDSLCKIEMVPQTLKDRIDYIGNSSRSGAILAAISSKHYHDTHRLLQSVNQVNLSTYEGFDRIFARACLFPAISKEEDY